MLSYLYIPSYLILLINDPNKVGIIFADEET